MAVTLSVPLNDNEQDKILEVVRQENPAATGPQVKAWAEKFMKNALRDQVVLMAQKQAREAANVAIRNAEQSLAATWVDPT
jgi:hypothetical protein